jgi:hypothetical protein
MIRQGIIPAATYRAITTWSLWVGAAMMTTSSLWAFVSKRDRSWRRPCCAGASFGAHGPSPASGELTGSAGGVRAASNASQPVDRGSRFGLSFSNAAARAVGSGSLS